MFNVYLSISILKTKRWRIVQWFPFTSTFKIDKCNAYRVKHPVSPSNIMNAERQKSKGLFAFYDQRATLFRRGITSHRIVICVLFNRFYKCAYVSFTLTIDFSWFPWMHNALDVGRSKNRNQREPQLFWYSFGYTYVSSSIWKKFRQFLSREIIAGIFNHKCWMSVKHTNAWIFFLQKF